MAEAAFWATYIDSINDLINFLPWYLLCSGIWALSGEKATKSEWVFVDFGFHVVCYEISPFSSFFIVYPRKKQRLRAAMKAIIRAGMQNQNKATRGEVAVEEMRLLLPMPPPVIPPPLPPMPKPRRRSLLPWPRPRWRWCDGVDSKRARRRCATTATATIETAKQ